MYPTNAQKHVHIMNPMENNLNMRERYHNKYLSRNIIENQGQLEGLVLEGTSW